MAHDLSYRFGPFLLDVAARRLLRNGDIVPVTPKVLDTLLFLVRNRGRVIAKEELLKAVWPDTFVEENNLTQNISALRRVLGEAAIETVPRHGYRFTLEAPADPPARRRRRLLAGSLAFASLAATGFLWWHSFRRPARIMLAVLPFENLSGDPQQEYFSNGLTAQMISSLGLLCPDRLGVIAWTSVRQYKGALKRIDQIARDLNVDYIVEGSVWREGNRVRINTQLIQARDQAQLWAEAYERDLRQILSVQADIGLAVTHGIGSSLRTDPRVRLALARPVHPEAYEAYLRRQYQKAIDLDPNYADAYSALAYMQYNQGLWGTLSPGDVFPKLKANAERAIRLDPSLGNAHGALGLYRLHYEFNWTESEAELRRALELDPSNGVTRHYYAHYLLAGNRGDESVMESRQAVGYDPFNVNLVACVAWHNLYAGEPDEAIDAARRALTMDKNHAFASLVLGWGYEQQRHYEEALAAFQKAAKWGYSQASIARGLAESGQRSQAAEILARLLEQSERTYVSAYEIALVYEAPRRQGQHLPVARQSRRRTRRLRNSCRLGSAAQNVAPRAAFSSSAAPDATARLRRPQTHKLLRLRGSQMKNGQPSTAVMTLTGTPARRSRCSGVRDVVPRCRGAPATQGSAQTQFRCRLPQPGVQRPEPAVGE